MLQKYENIKMKYFLIHIYIYIQIEKRNIKCKYYNVLNIIRIFYKLKISKNKQSND